MEAGGSEQYMEEYLEGESTPKSLKFPMASIVKLFAYYGNVNVDTRSCQFSLSSMQKW